MPSFESLKVRQRKERDNYPENSGLRVHRALSWLQRAEQAKDSDGRFIFLWIAFNAAYAQDFYDQDTATERFKVGSFLNKLVELDVDKRLYGLIWQEFPSSIRVLLSNRYVFGPFWEYQQGRKSEAEWTEAFGKANRAAKAAIGQGDTATALSVVLARLYTLRNQLVHGGATWDSRINRDQIRDATAILEKLVPIVIELMMDNPNTLWGEPSYPVVES